jgi:hypothetical protein
MFELEKDDRIRGIDRTSSALAMAFAHDFILELMLTNEMLDLGEKEAEAYSRRMVDRWKRRYGGPLTGGPEPSPETVRQLYATKAFVDRLARKALRRSAEMRAATAGQADQDPITPEMKKAGAAALAKSAHLSSEERAAEVFRAMARFS